MKTMHIAMRIGRKQIRATSRKRSVVALNKCVWNGKPTQQNPPGRSRLQRPRCGLSLLEVTVSTVLVGLIIVGSMRCVSTAIATGDSSANRTLAVLLAEDLLEEILQQDYSEPDDVPDFGIEGDEEATVRDNWDDVDDYDGWESSPPQDVTGNAVAGTEWKRVVVVEQVQSENLLATEPDSNDTGVKRITVVVSLDGVTLAELVSIQTRAWINMIPESGASNTTGQMSPSNEPPSAGIKPHVGSGTGSISVVFNGGNSTDPEDQPLEFNWDFGDGVASDQQPVAHTFVNSGSTTVVYTITLTVIDIHGAHDSATTTVTVYPNP